MRNILDYQNIDVELDRVIRQKDNFEELAVIEKMKNIVKNAQNNSVKLEDEAEQYLKEYDALKESYDKVNKEINKLTHMDLTNLTKDKSGKILSDINSLSSQLFMIERNLNGVINNISRALRDFEANKKNAVVARTKHKEAKDAYTAKVAKLEPTIAKLTADLHAMERDIKPETLAKYRAIKNDGVFPVYTTIQDGSCGYCRMELPKSKIDLLKNTDTIVCDHCHRIILKK